jgi:integrase
MSLGISVREKIEGSGWRYQRIEEKRGVKTSGLRPPFYIRRDGQWRRLSAQTFEAAKTERDELEAGKDALRTSDRVTLRTAVDRFLELKKRRNESTVENYTYILNEFLSKTSAKFVDEFNDPKNGRRIIDDYITTLENAGAAPQTIHNKAMVVTFMLREAGIDKPSRMAKDLLPTVEEEIAEPYTEDELKRIFASTEDDREYTAFMFFLISACREKEVAFAQWDDLVMINGMPHYRVQSKESFTTKNHKKRDVQINQEVVDLLQAHWKTVNESTWIFPNRDGRPDGHFLRKFKKICFAAGLNCGNCKTTRMEGRYNKQEVEKCCATYSEGCEKHYLHRLRKTRATFWHEHGVSLRTIQEWLGHESLETTEKYLGIQNPKQTERVVAKKMF